MIVAWGIVLGILILFSGFFAASEIGVMSFNKYRLRHLVKQKHKQAMRVNHLLERPDYFFSVVLIGNTICNILSSMIATLIGQKLYGEWGVLYATILLTLLVLIYAEMLPKTLGALYAQWIAFRFSFFLQWFEWLFAPLVWIVTRANNLTLSCFGVSLKTMPKEGLSGEELRTVLLEAGGMLPVEHKSMVISLLDLEKTSVEDIMIPKADLVGIDLEETWHELVMQLKTAQHTRLPLYRGNIENLVGIVHVRDLLHLTVDGEFTLEHLQKIMEAPYFIPEATPLNIQILHFRSLKKRSAFVVDEYGELQGLVTMEDILEEVVGEFTTDISSLNREVVVQGDGSYLIDGSLTVREVNRSLGWQLPLIGPRTLSGLIVESLGYIPPPECCLKIEGYHIEILKVQDNLIRMVRMWIMN